MFTLKPAQGRSHLMVPINVELTTSLRGLTLLNARLAGIVPSLQLLRPARERYWKDFQTAIIVPTQPV